MSVFLLLDFIFHAVLCGLPAQVCVLVVSSASAVLRETDLYSLLIFRLSITPFFLQRPMQWMIPIGEPGSNKKPGRQRCLEDAGGAFNCFATVSSHGFQDHAESCQEER